MRSTVGDTLRKTLKLGHRDAPVVSTSDGQASDLRGSQQSRHGLAGRGVSVAASARQGATHPRLPEDAPLYVQNIRKRASASKPHRASPRGLGTT